MGKENGHSTVLSNPYGYGRRLERTEEVWEKEQNADKSNLVFTRPFAPVFCYWDQCLSEPGYCYPQLCYMGCNWLFPPQELWVILKHNDLKSDWLALGRTADCQVPSAFNEPGKIFLREMLTQTDQFTESKAEAQTSPGVAGCMQSDNAGLVSIAAWWIWPHQLLPKMIPPQRWRDTDISVHNFLRPAAPYVC